jgi:hypothetical protein
MHSSVFKCFLRSDPQNPLSVFAVKQIREEDEEKNIVHKKEFEMMKRLDHPNIVKAHEIFVNEYKKEISIILQCI